MSFRSARRDLWLVVIARSVSWLGDEAAVVAMTLRLQSAGHGAGAVAALLIANLLPLVLLSGVVGRLLDRRDNRLLLIGSSLAQAALCSVLAFTSPTWAVLGLVAILGAGQSVNGAAWQALLPSIVAADELPKAVGRVQIGSTLAGVVAPALGGLLTGWYGARVPLLLDAATFLVITGAALLIATRRSPAAAQDGVRLDGAVRIAWTDALLRPLFVLLAVFVLLASTVNVADVFLVRETLHASTIWYGLAGAGFSLGALVGAVLSSQVRGVTKLARAFVLASVLLSVGLAAMGLVPSVAWLLPFGFVVGISNGTLNVALSSLVMGRAREDERGRIAALLTGIASGMQLLAFAAGGVLVCALSPRSVFVLAGVLGLLGPLLFGRAVVRAAQPIRPDTAPLPVLTADVT